MFELSEWVPSGFSRPTSSSLCNLGEPVMDGAPNEQGKKPCHSDEDDEVCPHGSSGFGKGDTIP